MDMINNLSDLCEFFDADGPDDLNRRIYRDHEIRINIRIGKVKQVLHTYTFKFEAGERNPIVKSVRKGGEFCNFSDLHVDVKHLFNLRVADNVIETDLFKSLEDFLKACREFMKMKYEAIPGSDFIKIKSVEDNDVTVIHGHLHDDSHLLESGNRWKISKIANLISFTFHSAVEGSDVTVESESFVVPVETSRVTDWIQEMQKQIDFYWKRENYSHWKLTNHEREEFYFDTGWSETIWHDDGKVPDTVKKRVISWTDKQNKNVIGVSHKFGAKDWTVEEYQDESTYEG